MKFLRRVTSLFLAILFSIALFCSNGIFLVMAEEETEEKVVTVFSVEDYIHEAEDDSEEGVLDVFERETGIKVNYLTFATNEDMYNELSKDPYACDLLCPSEYMIMKLMEEDMIRSFDTPYNFKKYGSPYIKDVFKGLKIGEGENVRPFMSEDEETSYAVGYMWGTVGLIYNTAPKAGGEITAKDLSSWSNIWTNFTKKVTIKDSIRDSYFIALAYVYQDELLSAKEEYSSSGDAIKYNQTLTEIFNRTDKESVRKVEEALLDLKNNLYGFEVDAGKNDVLTGKINVNVAWSGDAVCSIEEALFDLDGNLKEDPLYLGYAVPEEGSNIWFDGYVMNKNANYDNAIKFLDFIARPDVAVLNMDYTGYTSCIAGEEVFEYVLDSYDSDEGVKEYDLKYFFDPTHEGNDYVVNVEELYLSMFEAQYPTEEIINRCAVMQNFSGEDLERVNEMWKKVKLITLSTETIVLILLIALLVIAFALVVKYKEWIFEKLEKLFPNRREKSKLKVIKVEKIK